jgi:transcriptional regulator with XRE-family HTH domain
MTTDFPTWVRAEAKRRGWSQVTLTEQSGLSRSGISKMLTSDHRKPGMRFFVGIAAAFEMPVVDVIVIWEAGQRESDQDRTR